MDVLTIIIPLVNNLVAIGTLVSLVIKGINFIKMSLGGEVKMPSSVKLGKSFKENQFDDCNIVQYIAQRNSLILRAKQDAKKRPKTSYVNFVKLCILIAFCCFIPWLYDLLLSGKETTNSLENDVYQIAYNIVQLYLMVLIFLVLLMFSFNVPSWPDLIKKGRYNFTNKSMKERYYVHISRVIDLASNFDTYLLYDADSRRIVPMNRVIGAKNINESDNENNSICKVIESDLNKNGVICEMIKSDPSENGTDKSEESQDDMRKSAQADKKTAVVFIYSRHGKSSYDKTKKARTKYKDVYDLGSVCGEMRELEIVAHQLLYLKENNCLKLP